MRAHLASLPEVDALAETVLAGYDVLDILVNNAGVGFVGAPARELDDPLTEHGYDRSTAARRFELAQVRTNCDLAADLVSTGRPQRRLHRRLSRTRHGPRGCSPTRQWPA